MNEIGQQVLSHAWDINPTNVINFLIVLLLLQLSLLVFVSYILWKKVEASNLELRDNEKGYIKSLNLLAGALEGIESILKEMQLQVPNQINLAKQEIMQRISDAENRLKK